MASGLRTSSHLTGPTVQTVFLGILGLPTGYEPAISGRAYRQMARNTDKPPRQYYETFRRIHYTDGGRHKSIAIWAARLFERSTGVPGLGRMPDKWYNLFFYRILH